MIQLIPTEILFSYDEPHLFVAMDQVKTRYLCILASRDDRDATYVCVQISQDRLRQLKANEIDVLSAISDREVSHWYLVVASADSVGCLTANLRTDSIPLDYLPDRGIFLDEEIADDSVTVVARERNNIVVELKLDPPEASSNKIAAETLSGILSSVQSFLKRAYTRTAQSSAIHFSPRENEAVLDVFGFRPGSFIVQLESRAGIDLFGHTATEEALALVESALSNIDDPEQVLKFMEPYRGHFVSNFVQLLQVIQAAKSDLTVTWSVPRFTKANSTKVSRKEAEYLLSVLSKHQDLSVETVSVEGPLTKAVEKTGAWGLIDDKSQTEVSGTLLNKTPTALEGLVIGARYRVTCEERMTFDRVSGREKRKLYAIDFARIGYIELPNSP